MQRNGRIRIIKREERQAGGATVEPARVERRTEAERNMKTVVSGWVVEHRRRAEEFRRSYAALLKEIGRAPSQSPARG